MPRGKDNTIEVLVDFLTNTVPVSTFVSWLHFSHRSILYGGIQLPVKRALLVGRAVLYSQKNFLHHPPAYRILSPSFSSTIGQEHPTRLLLSVRQKGTCLGQTN